MAPREEEEGGREEALKTGLGFSKPPIPFLINYKFPRGIACQLRVKHLEISASAESVQRICHLSPSFHFRVSRSFAAVKDLAKRLLLRLV